MTEKPLSWVDQFLCGLITLLLTGLGALPRPLSRELGNRLGDIGFGLAKRHRRIVLDNLAFAMGAELNDRQRWRLARSIFRNLGQVLFEVGWSLSRSPEELQQAFRLEGVEHVRAAVQKGRGLLLITAHLGNWELLPFTAFREGIPLNVVYRPLDFKPLDRFFHRLRARYGARMISTRHAMFKIVRALKKNEAVAILMDQSVDWYDGVWVDFFGRRTCTTKGMALIALKSRAPVLPVFLYREPPGFVGVCGPEIPLSVTGDKTKDIETNTYRFSKAIEAGVRRHPEQWFWVHRRWKKRPYCPWPQSA